MLIEITGVTSSQSPYAVFLCNSDLTSCFYVSGNTSIPLIQMDVLLLKQLIVQTVKRSKMTYYLYLWIISNIIFNN